MSEIRFVSCFFCSSLASNVQVCKLRMYRRQDTSRQVSVVLSPQARQGQPKRTSEWYLWLITMSLCWGLVNCLHLEVFKWLIMSSYYLCELVWLQCYFCNIIHACSAICNVVFAVMNFCLQVSCTHRQLQAEGDVSAHQRHFFCQLWPDQIYMWPPRLT